MTVGNLITRFGLLRMCLDGDLNDNFALQILEKSVIWFEGFKTIILRIGDVPACMRICPALL